MSDREKYLARHRRYNRSPKGLERGRSHDDKRRSDPDYRRRRTIYMLVYRNRAKRERYATGGLLT